MSVTMIQTARWTCDVCSATVDNANGDENDIPGDWASLALSTEATGDKPLTADLCPECSGKLLEFLKLG